MMHHIKMIFLAIVLTGCASGSALVTGDTRNPIEDHQTVRILTEMPSGAIEIARVKASSEMGWNQQDRLDYAVEEIKKQAAKVGANAIVISETETSKGIMGVPSVTGGGTSGTSIYTTESEVVQGIAIWISNN